ncbi:DUF1232 domain-containing protein [Vitreoscilla massiliensis]|uniref:DUF1232 domain-containing protein n=1 Tax=Vitreoscilla massiliensis TaxID=1689272 RepID=A0ABY4DZQ3_9NEIS|nr:YkvA family protein [Vitreoscilla massiliensis]UOO89019.1 DUF1232 domain-containing protein [Vitreoscilla massiliensis]
MKRVKSIAADEQDVQNFNDQGFLRKLARYALRLGRPVVEQLYALYFMLQSQDTPMRSKMVIVGALLYFVSPVDLVPDILGPLGFSDDLAVIAMVYKQMKIYLTADIRARAAEATAKLMQRMR